jgi:NAD(P)-dependent dehydrogenase (short-subunit alcohol dehydrogenase family)
MGELEGKVALVTGGNSGIGLATAKAFVREGAYVFATGRRERELAEAVSEIGSNVCGVPGDVSKVNDLECAREVREVDGILKSSCEMCVVGRRTNEHRPAAPAQKAITVGRATC